VFSVDTDSFEKDGGTLAASATTTTSAVEASAALAVATVSGETETVVTAALEDIFGDQRLERFTFGL
jgi:hypothetical protein